MSSFGKAIACILVGLLGLVGLFFAANAEDGGIYYSGLLIFVTALTYIFLIVKRTLDESERAHREGPGEG